MRSTGVDLFAGVCTTGCLDRRVRGFLIASFLLCLAGDLGLGSWLEMLESSRTLYSKNIRGRICSGVLQFHNNLGKDLRFSATKTMPSVDRFDQCHGDMSSLNHHHSRRWWSAHGVKLRGKRRIGKTRRRPLCRPWDGKDKIACVMDNPRARNNLGGICVPPQTHVQAVFAGVDAV